MTLGLYSQLDEKRGSRHRAHMGSLRHLIWLDAKLESDVILTVSIECRDAKFVVSAFAFYRWRRVDAAPQRLVIASQ